MTKVSKPSQRLLRLFASWNESFLVLPSGRFIVSYRKSMKLRDKMMVEGWLRETFDSEHVYAMNSIKDGEYFSKQSSEHPDAAFIDKLLAADVTAKFTLDKFQIKAAHSLTKGNKFVEIIMEENPKTQAFRDVHFDDNAKPPSSSSPPPKPKLSLTLYVKGEARENSSIKIPSAILKHLPTGDYSFSILSNNHCIASAIDDEFTVYAAI